MNMDFGDFFWLLIWSFVFVFYLMILFQIIGDLFRDKELSGWLKALWIVALILVPFLTALIYLIARGRGMAERQAGQVQQAQAATDSYIKEVAGRGVIQQNKSPPPRACLMTAQSPRPSSTNSRQQLSRNALLMQGAVAWAVTEPKRPASTNSIRTTGDREFLKQRSHMRFDRVQRQE